MDLSARLFRELLFWAPAQVVFELRGALQIGSTQLPVDLSMRAQRRGSYGYEGSVGPLGDCALQGSGQLQWAAGEPSLCLYLSPIAAGLPSRAIAWRGSFRSGARTLLPAGAEFTGAWPADETCWLTLRLDYRSAFERSGFGRSLLGRVPLPHTRANRVLPSHAPFRAP